MKNKQNKCVYSIWEKGIGFMKTGTKLQEIIRGDQNSYTYSIVPIGIFRYIEIKFCYPNTSAALPWNWKYDIKVNWVESFGKLM